MDICKVAGYLDYSFQDQDGRQVAGRKYQLLIMPSRSETVGFEVVSQSIMKPVLDNWRKVGQYIPEFREVCRVMYNRHGRIDGFEEIEDAGDAFSEL